MNKKPMLSILITLVVLVAMLSGCQVAPTPTPVVQRVVEQVIITATPMDTSTPIIQTIIVTATPEPVTPTVPPTATPEPGTTIELSGPKGAMTLSIDELKKLKVTEGWAGIKSSTGRITPPAYFKGVSLIDLCNQVGTFDPSIALNIVAKDGYAMTFSYDQIAKGDFVTFNPATGQENKIDDDLTVIVAFERDGEAIPGTGEGPLRLAIVSANKDQVTDGHWSVKWTRQLQVKPAAIEWTLHLEGVITEEMDRNTFESGSSPSCHLAEWTDADGHVWGGIPLYYLMGRVDDTNTHEGDAFDYDRAEAGYTVDVIAADGYAVTLDSAPLVRNKDIFIANMMDGEPLPEEYFPLRLVGKELTKGQMVASVAQIVLDLPAAEVEAAAEPTEAPTTEPAKVEAASPAVAMEPGTLHVYGKVAEPIAFSVAALEQMGLTEIEAEHPKKGMTKFQGVLINDILASTQAEKGATCMFCTAGDGFTVDIPLGDVLNCAECLLQIDGDTFNLIMPGMMSNTWVKDVRLIEIK